MSRETEISGASSVEPADGGSWPARERLRLYGMLITTMLLGVVACVIIRPYWPDRFPLLSERWPYIKLEHLEWLPYLFALHVPILCGLGLRYRWLRRGWLAASCAMAAGLAGMLSHILAQTACRRWDVFLFEFLGRRNALAIRGLYGHGPLAEALLYGAVSLLWWVLFLMFLRCATPPAPSWPPAAPRTRLRRVGAAAVAVLLVFQAVSYALWAERTMPLTAFRRMSRSSRTEFVCVSQGSWANLTSEQQKALDSRLHQLADTVYHSREDIPLENRNYGDLGDGRRLLNLIGGSIWEWELRGIGPFWFTAHYGHWVSLKAARHTGATFVWFLGAWVHRVDAL